MAGTGDNLQLGLNIINWLAEGGTSHLPGGASIEEAVARLVPNDPPGVSNPDTYIGDQEILRAQQLWTTGSPVPGTDGKTIDDATMMKLLGMWSSRKPVSRATSAAYPSENIVELDVEKIGLLPNPVKSAGTIALRVEGTGIAGLKVEIFSLAGRKVFEQEASGNALRFYALDDRGRPLANGVYLYVVTVRGFNGEMIRSEVKKLVVLR
jgi:hypothetical protein